MAHRIDVASRDKVIETVDNILRKRTQIAEPPFNTSPEAYRYWESLMPTEVTTSIKHISDHSFMKILIRETYYVTLNVCGYTIHIEADTALPWGAPYKGLVVPDSDGMYIKLLTFAEDRLRIEQETAATMYMVRTLLTEATSAGQVKRVWPELLPMLPIGYTQELIHASRASRIPYGFPYTEFINEKATYDRVLAEGRILPDIQKAEVSFKVNAP